MLWKVPRYIGLVKWNGIGDYFVAAEQQSLKSTTFHALFCQSAYEYILKIIRKIRSGVKEASVNWLSDPKFTYAKRVCMHETVDVNQGRLLKSQEPSIYSLIHR